MSSIFEKFDCFCEKIVWEAAEYKRTFVSGVVRNYFADSYKEMVSFFAKEQKISAAYAGGYELVTQTDHAVAVFKIGNETMEGQP